MTLGYPGIAPVLSALAEVIARFGKPQPVSVSVDASLEFITQHLRADLAEIWKVSPGDDLVLMGTRSTSQADDPAAVVLSGDSNPYHVFRSGEALVVNELSQDFEVALRDYSRGVFAESLAYLPIRGTGRILGVLGVASGNRRFFSPETTEVLKILAVCLGQVMQQGLEMVSVPGQLSD